MQYWRAFKILLTTCSAGLILLFPHALLADIYRTVDANGVVSYSDQPSPGAQQLETVAASEQTPSQAQEAAQRAARLRVEQELALAERLAADRLDRSEARQSRALARAELRESRARERTLAAEQQALQAQRDSYDDRFFPNYGPYFPRGRHGRRHHTPAPYKPFDSNYYDKRYYPYQQPVEPEPSVRVRVPAD